MRIYDISQEIFSGAVYKGDPIPSATPLQLLSKGDDCNLSAISLCVHNATHIDAPSHYIPGGKTIDQLDLVQTVGPCVVLMANGSIDADFLTPLLDRGVKRILFKNNGTLGIKAARTLAERGVLLVGTENQSIGNGKMEDDVHQALLGQGVAILEGIVLTDVPEGNYYLCAAPLKLGGLEGAPCRALLIDYVLGAQ